MTTEVPADLLDRFGLRDAEPLAETEIADIWRVQRADGPAVLKLYKNNDMQDEASGFDYLQALDGHDAVKVFARHGAAVVMELADGMSLGDLSRAGQDEKACAELVAIAAKLHQNTAVLRLPLLHDRFQDLLCAPLTAPWPQKLHKPLGQAQSLARSLLQQQTDIGPLHGDLHHDNIKSSARGFLAFDAKGVIGPRAYDYANSFKNPFDQPQTHTSPQRIQHLAQQWHRATGETPKHILQWAAAHCALSMIWSGPDKGAQDGHLLEQLLAAVP